MIIAGVMAGGKGTRISVGQHVPKPLVKVNGRPLIDHVMGQFRDANITKVTIEVRPDDRTVAPYVSRCWGNLFDLLFVSAERDMGSASSVLSILRDGRKGPRVIATTDTIAPPGAVSRLVQTAGRSQLNPEMVLLATEHIHDSSPIWLQCEGEIVRSMGKGIPRTTRVFGNVRWLSASACNTIAALPAPPIRDSEIMREFVEAHAGAVIVHLENPVFDLDDADDLREATEWLNSLT